MSEIKLWCWVLGDTRNRAFGVTIERSATIDDLKTAIHGRKPSFKDVAAESLSIFKFQLPLEFFNEDCAQSIKLEDGQSLEFWRQISFYWMEDPGNVLSVILPRPAGSTIAQDLVLHSEAPVGPRGWKVDCIFLKICAEDVWIRGGEADGKERVEHLQKIYASLVSKDVPNVDRLKKAEILHRKYGSFVDLEPVGISEGPKSLLDVRNAAVCVLEALKVAYADPPVFEDASKWFLIGWEDASFAPTKAIPHLNHASHSPKVYKDNHGADVDIWAVGRLLINARWQTPALKDLGQRMIGGHVLSAEQGLKEICDLP